MDDIGTMKISKRGHLADHAIKQAEGACHTLTLILSNEELQDLYRILLDQDEVEALEFLRTHLKGAVRDLVKSE